MFGEVNNGVMKLNNYGEIVKEEWFKTNFLRDNVELVDEEFVVMPNHIHGIIWIIEGGRGSGGRGTARCAPTDSDNAPTDGQFGIMIPRSIPTIVRSYKSAITKQINLLRQTPGESVWQRNYYERIVRDEYALSRIREDIRNNPALWGKDKMR